MATQTSRLLVNSAKPVRIGQKTLAAFSRQC